MTKGDFREENQPQWLEKLELFFSDFV